jgi:uncharacterized protein (DUF58 family)
LTKPAEHGEIDDSRIIDALKHLDSGSTTGSLIFVIAAINQVTAGLERTLGSLRQRHDVLLLPIDDPADRDLPAIGSIIFSNTVGELLEVDTDNEMGRQAFREDWELRRDELRQMSYRLGIGLIPVSTDDDVHHVLTEGLRRYAGGRV